MKKDTNIVQYCRLVVPSGGAHDAAACLSQSSWWLLGSRHLLIDCEEEFVVHEAGAETFEGRARCKRVAGPLVPFGSPVVTFAFYVNLHCKTVQRKAH